MTRCNALQYLRQAEWNVKCSIESSCKLVLWRLERTTVRPQRSLCSERSWPWVHIAAVRRKKEAGRRWFPCISTWGLCVWHTVLKKVQKKPGRRVTTSIQWGRGRDLARASWHGHNAWRDGSTLEPTETEGSSSGPKAATQRGHGGRWEGEQIRSRGENWDRFSCRCWDKRPTNDLTVWLVLGGIECAWGRGWGVSGGGAQWGCDRYSGKLDLNYKRNMQIILKCE